MGTTYRRHRQHTTHKNRRSHCINDQALHLTNQHTRSAGADMMPPTRPHGSRHKGASQCVRLMCASHDHALLGTREARTEFLGEVAAVGRLAGLDLSLGLRLPLVCLEACADEGKRGALPRRPSNPGHSRREVGGRGVLPAPRRADGRARHTHIAHVYAPTRPGASTSVDHTRTCAYMR